VIKILKAGDTPQTDVPTTLTFGIEILPNGCPDHEMVRPTPKSISASTDATFELARMTAEIIQSRTWPRVGDRPAKLRICDAVSSESDPRRQRDIPKEFSCGLLMTTVSILE
jgi:hypothetical protein